MMHLCSWEAKQQGDLSFLQCRLEWRIVLEYSLPQSASLEAQPLWDDSRRNRGDRGPVCGKELSRGHKGTQRFGIYYSQRLYPQSVCRQVRRCTCVFWDPLQQKLPFWALFLQENPLSLQLAEHAQDLGTLHLLGPFQPTLLVLCRKFRGLQ